MARDETGRARIIHKVADQMEAHAEELAQLETLDNGKPIKFAREDVFASIGAIRYYAGWADKIHGSTHNVNMPGEYHVYTLLKPAEDTSLSALRLGELTQEAGLPDGVVNVLTGYGRTVGAALASHPVSTKLLSPAPRLRGRRSLTPLPMD